MLAIEMKVSLDERGPESSTALHLACEHASDECIKHLLESQARVEATASEHAAVAKVREKDSKYAALCQAQGVEFLPLAVCAYGGWLPAGEEFAKQLARRLSDRTGLDSAIAISQFWQRASLALWRWNARLILKGTSAPRGQWAQALLRA